MAKKVTYSEPADYIPKSIRKNLKIGEYSPEPASKNNSKSSGTKTGSKKK